ncbi:unnamed protein product [Merluccius merluccius]
MHSNAVNTPGGGGVGEREPPGVGVGGVREAGVAVMGQNLCQSLSPPPINPYDLNSLFNDVGRSHGVRAVTRCWMACCAAPGVTRSSVAVHLS